MKIQLTFSELLQAYFTYYVAAWKPIVKYQTGVLSIE